MDFRTNSWYRLASAASMKSQLSLVGDVDKNNSLQGTATYSSSDNNAPAQQWQLFPFNSLAFVLRTKANGPSGLLGVEPRDGSPTLHIYKDAGADGSTSWHVVPWGDGTFYFSTDVNGTTYHLDFEGPRRATLSTNFTQPQPGQAFSFVKLGEINDSAFSTVSTALLNPTPPSYAISTPIPITTIFSNTPTTLTASMVSTTLLSTALLSTTSSPTSTSAPAKGLPTTAAIGIGVTSGALAVLFISAIALFLYQRYKQHRSPEAKQDRKAKMWDGFTPQSRESIVFMAENTVAELPGRSTPCSMRREPSANRQTMWPGLHFGLPPEPFSPLSPTSSSMPIGMFSPTVQLPS